MEVNAVVLTSVEKVELGKVTLPELSADELRVEAVMTCLSPGTDLRVLTGKQAGEWNWPVVPGYSMVGQVIDLGAEVTDFYFGDRVFCIGTQKASCDLLWGANVAVGTVTLGKVVKIPDGLEREKTCLAKLASFAYHGCKRSGATAGSRVSIVGAGPIGLFSALFHQECGATVVFLELFNEPTNFRGKIGDLNWSGFKVYMEELIDMIQHIDPEVIPLVTGFDWAYDLSHVDSAPVEADGIAYVVHPYSQKRTELWGAEWQRDWGYVAERYPIVATEFRFMAA